MSIPKGRRASTVALKPGDVIQKADHVFVAPSRVIEAYETHVIVVGLESDERAYLRREDLVTYVVTSVAP